MVENYVRVVRTLMRTVIKQWCVRAVLTDVLRGSGGAVRNFVPFTFADGQQVGQEAPRTVMFLDDISICDESRENRIEEEKVEVRTVGKKKINKGQPIQDRIYIECGGELDKLN